MGLSVVPHQARPVHTEYHVELVNGHIVEKHIVTALKERGVHGKHREEPLFRHPRRHGHRMALGNPHIEKALGELFGKPRQACPAGHRGRDGADARILLRQALELRTKASGKALPAAALQ